MILKFTFIWQFSTGGPDRPAIWLDAGIHAREWVTQATALWTAQKVISDTIDFVLFGRGADYYPLIPMFERKTYLYPSFKQECRNIILES